MTDHPYRSSADVEQHVIVTTGNDIAGYSVEQYLDVVRGVVVRLSNIGFNADDLDQISQFCEATRREALVRMVAHARTLGAQAVLAMRYDTVDLTSRATEVLAYGTAVLISRVG